MRRCLRLVALVLVTVGWNAALFAAPDGEPPQLAAMTYLAGSLLCHQQSERSFHRAGAQFPVCARCLGLYVGAGVGVLGWLFIAGAGAAPTKLARRIVAANIVTRALVVVAMPTLTSVALASMGVWDGSNWLRAALALPLGAIIAAVVAAVLARDLR